MGANPAVLVAAEGRYSPLPMALHTSNHSNAMTAAAGSASCSVTTTVPNTILVAIVSQYNVSDGTDRHLTSLATTGLTWNNRSTFKNASGSTYDCEVWWAACPTPGTYNVTATFNVNAIINLTVMAVTGVKSATKPFDTNASISSSAWTNLGSVTQASKTGISTDDANSFVFAHQIYSYTGGSGDTLAVGTIGGTAANLVNTYKDTNSGGLGAGVITEYLVKTAKLSNATVNFAGMSFNEWSLIGVDTLAG